MKKVILNVISVLLLLSLAVMASTLGYVGWVDSQSGCQFNFMAGLIAGWCGSALFFSLLLTITDYVKRHKDKGAKD